jgi:hypothetical protein
VGGVTLRKSPHEGFRDVKVSSAATLVLYKVWRKETPVVASGVGHGQVTMSEYDDWTRRELPEKIPARSRDWRRRAGDAIYDFDDDPPTVHKDAFHTVANRKTDLGGRYALLSEHFYYFGGMPLELLEHLRPIIPTGQAHQSPKNDPYVEPFEAWITSGFEANKLYGMPRGMPRSPESVTIGRKPE